MNSVSQLNAIAQDVRAHLLTMIFKAQSGHPGGSLSASDIMTVLYFSEMNIDPQNPDWPERDRFVLSKGHCCPVLYSVLALRGYFDMSHLGTLRKLGSILQGHPVMKKTPGVDMTTGSLGQGLSIGIGIALSFKRNNTNNRAFVLMGDGETNEGQIWEAAASAAKYKLNNLIAIIDRNGIQNDGFCNDIMPMNDLTEKWKAFGWDVFNVDGHNIEALQNVFKKIKYKKSEKPTCIVAETVKGKYVSFMENNPSWHGKAPNESEYEIAIHDIRQ